MCIRRTHRLMLMCLQSGTRSVPGILHLYAEYMVHFGSRSRVHASRSKQLEAARFKKKLKALGKQPISYPSAQDEVRSESSEAAAPPAEPACAAAECTEQQQQRLVPACAALTGADTLAPAPANAATCGIYNSRNKTTSQVQWLG